MIKTISGSSKHISVSCSSNGTYVNGYSGAQGVGNMRYNTTSQCIEVFDGTSWIMLNMGHANVYMSGDAENAIDWAIKERNERLKIEHMAKENVTVADALDRVRLAEEQLKVIAALCEQEEKQ